MKFRVKAVRVLIAWGTIAVSAAIAPTAWGQYAAQTGDAQLAARQESADRVESGILLFAETALSYDGNIFAAPRSPYVDFAEPSGENPLVKPNIQSGYFVPVKLGAKATVLVSPFGASAGFRYRSDTYLSDAHETANRRSNKISGEVELAVNQKGKKRDRLSIGVFTRTSEEKYFDHDSGDPKLSSKGLDISNRYNFRSTGHELAYTQDTTAIRFKIRRQFEERDYDKPSAGREYDHTYTLVGADVSANVVRSTKLSLGASKFSRVYTDRRARDLTGTLTKSASLTYDFYEANLSVRHKFSRKLIAYTDYGQRTREDDFVGYNDYFYQRLRFRGIYKLKKNLRARAVVATWSRRYPRAFAFDKPAGGRKRYNGIDADLKVEYTAKRFFSYWVDVDYTDQRTTDKRFSYQRMVLTLGVRAEY